jgi:glutamate-1-semialdehyde 2,1-aminomutase
VLAEATDVIPGGYNSNQRGIDPPIAIRRAHGAYFEDVEGRRYLDYHAAFGPMVLGHCYPEVVDAVASALRETDLYGVGTTEMEVALARKIVDNVPSVEEVLLCNSGSEATYHAIRLARAATGRSKLIKFQSCYHGWHNAVLRNVLSRPEMVGQRDVLSAGMVDAVVDNTLVCRFNDLEDVEQTVRSNADQVAAIILEPIPHNVGTLPEPGFLEGLRTLCDRGGGMRSLMDHFNSKPGGDVFFAGTYNGHAAGVVAALATIELLETGKVQEHIGRLGDRLRHGLQDMANRAGVPALATGFGSIFRAVLHARTGAQLRRPAAQRCRSVRTLPAGAHQARCL